MHVLIIDADSINNCKFLKYDHIVILILTCGLILSKNLYT